MHAGPSVSRTTQFARTRAGNLAPKLGTTHALRVPMNKRTFTSCALAALVFTLAPAAFAQEIPTTDPEAPSETEARVQRHEVPPEAPTGPAKSQWYGWQTLTVDGLSTAAAFGGIGLSVNSGATGGALFFIGMGGYVLGAPAIHLAHAEYGRAGLSLGVRLVAPAVLGVIANAASRNCDKNSNDWINFCREGSTALGVGLGMLTAMAIDAAISWSSKGREERREEKPSVLPDVMVSPQGARAGISGRF